MHIHDCNYIVYATLAQHNSHVYNNKINYCKHSSVKGFSLVRVDNESNHIKVKVYKTDRCTFILSPALRKEGEPGIKVGKVLHWPRYVADVLLDTRFYMYP